MVQWEGIQPIYDRPSNSLLYAPDCASEGHSIDDLRSDIRAPSLVGAALPSLPLAVALSLTVSDVSSIESPG